MDEQLKHKKMFGHEIFFNYNSWFMHKKGDKIFVSGNLTQSGVKICIHYLRTQFPLDTFNPS